MAALITALGLASNVAFITGNGASLTDLFSLDGLVEFATAASSERYSNLAPPALSQALLPFVFLAPMVGGLLFGEVKSRVRLLALFTVVPGLVITVTQTAKAGSLIAGLLFISGYCTSQVRRNRLQMFTWHRCLIVLIAALPFTGFMYFVTFSRGGILDPALFQVASDKLRSALVGHMAVFSDWLTAYPQNTPDPTLGAYTFAGPAEALGLSTRIGGLFETTYFLNFGQSSNIYTAFRPLIQDFTVTGAVALLLAMGLAGGIGYRQVGSGRWWAATQLLLFYAITIWSPITWLLTYNSQIAAVIGLLGVLLTVPGLPGRWPPTLLRPGPRPDMRGIPEPTR